MEEGQDVQACSANEKTVYKLATKLNWKGEEKVVSNVNITQKTRTCCLLPV